jgi:hypothetical protein
VSAPHGSLLAGPEWGGDGPLPSPVNVAHRLLQLGRLFDEAERELAQRDEEHVRAKQQREVAYAKAFLTGHGSVENRKQEAVLEVADLTLGAEIAEMLVRSAKERIKKLDRQMEVARSVGATTRAEMAAGGGSWNP